MLRNKCLLCGGNLKQIFKIKMPVFMGVNEDRREEIIENMNFVSCGVCGELQIKELLDSRLVYAANHNIGTIGKTWENHYAELVNFIGNVDNKTILEIGDPSAKIAIKANGYKNWYIVEPNPDNIEIENVTFIKSFFEEPFDLFENIDLIVSSHSLEHIHDPHRFFKKCHKLLTTNGIMVISVPDMDFFLNQKHSPAAILQFEHTYFINEEVLNILASENGFSIVEIKKYNNHSIFYKLKKEDKKLSIRSHLQLNEKIKINLSAHFNNIEKINKNMVNHKVYLFGAHVTSQFYIFNGLMQNYIKAILDNATYKQGYKLYGTHLEVLSPLAIKEEECAVICSHVGIYYEEICQQLKKINNKVVIL